MDALAAYRIYGGPACIVDFGTATTFDAITADGDYLGGAIAPGIGISADALFQHAAKLPKVDIARPPTAIGRNTIHAMQAGLLFGYVGLVEGMVTRFRAELGPAMKVIATGGLAGLIAEETAVIEHIAPWLTLDGLRMVYAMNRPGQDDKRTRMIGCKPSCHPVLYVILSSVKHKHRNDSYEPYPRQTYSARRHGQYCLLQGG